MTDSATAASAEEWTFAYLEELEAAAMAERLENAAVPGL